MPASAGKHDIIIATFDSRLGQETLTDDVVHVSPHGECNVVTHGMLGPFYAAVDEKDDVRGELGTEKCEVLRSMAYNVLSQQYLDAVHNPGTWFVELVDSPGGLKPVADIFRNYAIRVQNNGGAAIAYGGYNLFSAAAIIVTRVSELFTLKTSRFLFHSPLASDEDRKQYTGKRGEAKRQRMKLANQFHTLYGNIMADIVMSHLNGSSLRKLREKFSSAREDANNPRNEVLFSADEAKGFVTRTFKKPRDLERHFVNTTGCPVNVGLAHPTDRFFTLLKIKELCRTALRNMFGDDLSLFWHPEQASLEGHSYRPMDYAHQILLSTIGKDIIHKCTAEVLSNVQSDRG